MWIQEIEGEGISQAVNKGYNFSKILCSRNRVIHMSVKALDYLSKRMHPKDFS